MKKPFDLNTLPEKAYLPNRHHCAGPNGEPPLIAVMRGEEGYWPIYTDATADELNAQLGVTEDQAKAMEHGSMFGWDTPGCDPEWHRELRERREAVSAVVPGEQDDDKVYTTREDAVRAIEGWLGDGGSYALASRVYDYMREQGIVTHNGTGLVIERDANVFQFAADLSKGDTE